MIVKQHSHVVGTAIFGALLGAACNQAMLLGQSNLVALFFGTTAMMCLGALVGSGNAVNSWIATLLGGVIGILAGLIASVEIRELLFNSVWGLICGYLLSTITDDSTITTALRQAVKGAGITALLAVVALVVVYLIDSNGSVKAASLRPEAVAIVLNARWAGSGLARG